MHHKLLLTSYKATLRNQSGLYSLWPMSKIQSAGNWEYLGDFGQSTALYSHGKYL